MKFLALCFKNKYFQKPATYIVRKLETLQHLQWRNLGKIWSQFSNNLTFIRGFPGGSYGKKNLSVDAGDTGSILRVGKIPWRKEWLPTPAFLPGESHGQTSLVGCSPWGCKEKDMTEWLTLSHWPPYKRRNHLLYEALEDESERKDNSVWGNILWKSNEQAASWGSQQLTTNDDLVETKIQPIRDAKLQ